MWLTLPLRKNEAALRETLPALYLPFQSTRRRIERRDAP